MKNLILNEDTKKLEPATEELKERIRSLLNKSTPTIPYLRKEGVFDITLINKQSMETKEGVMFTFKLIDDDTVYKAGIFYDGFSYSDDEIIPVDVLVDIIPLNSDLTIRLSKNFRGTNFYIRYIKINIENIIYEAGKEFEDEN